MLQSSLTFQGDHDAWKQRVHKESGNAQKFYQTWDIGGSTFNQTGFTNQSVTSNTIHPYHKSNLDRKILKRGNYYMIDSTYLVASNPNTMRDLGPCRNAEYYFTPSWGYDETGAMKNTFQTINSSQSPEKVGKTFFKNKDGYSFGGKTKFGDMTHHKNAYTGLVELNPSYYVSKDNKWSKSIDESKLKVYREYNQKVNDYTKNISQTIFSPGLTISADYTKYNKTPNKHRGKLMQQRRSIGYNQNYPQNIKQYQPLRSNAFQLKVNRDRIRNKPQSAGKSYRSAKSLSKMIHREKRYFKFN